MHFQFADRIYGIQNSPYWGALNIGPNPFRISQEKPEINTNKRQKEMSCAQYEITPWHLHVTRFFFFLHQNNSKKINKTRANKCALWKWRLTHKNTRVRNGRNSNVSGGTAPMCTTYMRSTAITWKRYIHATTTNERMNFRKIRLTTPKRSEQFDSTANGELMGFPTVEWHDSRKYGAILWDRRTHAHTCRRNTRASSWEECQRQQQQRAPK